MLPVEPGSFGHYKAGGDRTSNGVVDITLGPGEFYFGGDSTRLRTLLGSCVAGTFWHPRLQIGGMCHYLLPSRGSSPCSRDSPFGLYADEVIDWFAHKVAAAGTHPADYVVKLFGGADMLHWDKSLPVSSSICCSPELYRPCDTVPRQNVLAAHELMAKHGFPVATEDVGGRYSRLLVFELWSGRVWRRLGANLAA
jgi:chemotaxis protein CheD